MILKKNLNETSKKLGFHTGASVRISPRYFHNHSMKYINIGTGVIVGKTLPDKNTLPSLLVRFPFHMEFFTEPILKCLLETSQASAGTINVLLRIHPLYCDEVKRYKGRLRSNLLPSPTEE